MAIITVRNNADSGNGSLRDALLLAATNGDPNDYINFAQSMAGKTITLSSALEITEDVTIFGDLGYDGDADITISGDTNENGVADAGDSRFLTVRNNAIVRIEGVDFANGYATTAGGGQDANVISVQAGSALRLDNVSVADSIVRVQNEIENANFNGGDATTILNAGDLTMTGSDIRNNASYGGDGADGDDSFPPTGGGDAVAGVTNLAGAAVRLFDVAFSGSARGGDGGDGAPGFSDAGANGGDAVLGILNFGAVTAIPGAPYGAYYTTTDVSIFAGGGGLPSGDSKIVGESGSIYNGVFNRDDGTSDARYGVGGAEGDDVLGEIGGVGGQILLGLAGDDTINGGIGSDTLLGGSGADTINVSGVGLQKVFGGKGGDFISLLTALGDIEIDGGDNNDLLDLSQYALPPGEGFVVDLTGATTTAAEGLSLTVRNIENIFGSAGADDITGTNGVNTIYGNGGNDTIAGNDGVDFIVFGAVLSDQNPVISNTPVTISANGGGGQDGIQIFEGAFNATIDGGTGPIGAEGDTLGIATDDAIRVDLALETKQVVNLQSEITVTGVENFNGVVVGNNGGVVGLGTEGRNTLQGAGGSVFLDGRGGDDVLEALTGLDELAPGDATLIGGAGDDRLVGNIGDDELFGGGDDDTLIGGEGADELSGGDGVDSLEGGGGDDFLRSGAGAESFIVGEVLNGGDGEDTLVSDNGGSRSLQGGDNNDLLQVLGGAAFLDGGDGFDQVQFFENFDAFDFFLGDEQALFIRPAGEDLSFIGAGAHRAVNVEEFIFADRFVSAQSIIDDLTPNPPVEPPTEPPTAPPPTPTPPPAPTAGPTPGDDNLIGTGAADSIDALAGNDTVMGLGGGDTLSGGGGKDVLIGNGGKDVLDGNGGKDSLEGGGGKDLLNGGGGKDTLSGGGGKDTLDGGGGKDVMQGGGGKDLILGGKGNDSLTGNGGRDVFQFKTGDRKDTITDFNQRQDKIEITNGADAFADLVITQAGDNVRIRFSNVQITVDDSEAGEFTANDFIFSG